MTAIRKQFLNDQEDYSKITTEAITPQKNTPRDGIFTDEQPSPVLNHLFGPDDEDDDDDLIPIDDDNDDDILPDGGDDDLSDDDEDDFLAEEADDDLLADNDDDTNPVNDDEDDDYDGDVRSVGDFSPPSERSHGRTTGRMIDHEPGTPNNL